MLRPPYTSLQSDYDTVSGMSDRHPLRLFFLEHYNKAMTRLTRQSGNPVSLEAILMACLLFISVENFQHHNDLALNHIRAGTKIIKE